ncbi:MAG: SUMF1/EgtB/PvdO family nonheme iron enzyme [Deltaproteobacteria bacterium]|nr:SUMF1/EgtB/PvdO family nonheme iron enzyme [Deltaproteobacteria bacterium]
MHHLDVAARAAAQVAVLLLLGAAACSDPPAAGKSDTTTSGSDANADGNAVDAATDVDAAQSDAGEDVAADVGPSCPGQAGCACTSPADCDSGACIETSEGRICTRKCVEDCPAGQVCLPLGGGADALNYCLPRWGLLCRPCELDADCAAPGVKDARCVDHGGAGGFCGAACAVDADCPSGTGCRDVQRKQGGSARQCVPLAAGGGAAAIGACLCTADWAARKLTTSCEVEQHDDAGEPIARCKGEAACTTAGAAASCVGLSGPAAACVDLQCIDPKTGAAKADGASCTDGDGCTAGDACKSGACVPGPDTCACKPVVKPCEDDGDLCNGTPYCDTSVLPFVCKANPASVPTCDASLDTLCAKNACVPADGSCKTAPVERTTQSCPGNGLPCSTVWLPETAPDATAPVCDDGDLCTKSDVCKGGACNGGTGTCACKSDADCPDGDGDPCTGVPYCDKSGADWLCKPNPASVVVCPTDGDSACAKSQCSKATGACSVQPLADAVVCSDGEPCTTGDACQSGVCVPGTWTCKCQSDADCAAKEDGDLCNGTLFCNKQSGNCELNPATVVTCPSVDDTACKARSCDPKTGACPLLPIAEGKACDDDNACTNGDVCKSGACSSGTNTCPCSSDADCVGKDDGNLCNGTLYCNPVGGPGGTSVCLLNPATVVSCPSVDDTPCSKNACAPKTGLCAPAPLPAGEPCDADGTACTQGDACDGKGGCLAGKGVCACVKDADCAPLDDGDACNGALFCDKALATPTCRPNPATVVSCAAGEAACAPLVCEPKTGTCAAGTALAGEPCEDGAACTVGDACDGKGACVAGPSACPCGKDADCAGLGDGDPCKGSWSCGGGGKGCVFDPKPGVGCVVDPDPDHDGVCADAKCVWYQVDACPTVYNPGGDPGACAALPASLVQRRALQISQPGLAAGQSDRRRTHEIVDVPLQNGDLGSLVVRLLPANKRVHADGVGDCVWAGTPVADVAGVPGFAASLEAGKKEAMACALTSDIYASRNQMTVMAWVRPNLVGGKLDAVALSGAKGQGFSQLELFATYDGSQKIGVRITPGELPNAVAELTAALPDASAWHHVALTWEGELVGLYLDGDLIATSKSAWKGYDFRFPEKFVIGARPDASGTPAEAFWNGAIGEVVFLDRAASPFEIAAYVQSRVPFGARLTPGARDDFGDVRVYDGTDANKPTLVPMELRGIHRHAVDGAGQSGVVAAVRMGSTPMCQSAGGAAKPCTILAGGSLNARPGRNGQPDGAVDFVAPQHEIATPFTTIWNGVDDATLTIWLRVGIGPSGVLIGAHGSLYFGFGGTDTLTPVIYYDGTKTQSSGAWSFAGKKNRWVHIAFVVRKGTYALAIDGKITQLGTKLSASSIGGPALTIGKLGNYPQANNHVKGVVVGDVELYRRALTDGELRALAAPLPHVRTLISTATTAKGATFPLRAYGLAWGDPALTAPTTALTGPIPAVKPATIPSCREIASTCLGVLGWWPLHDLSATEFRDEGSHAADIPHSIANRVGQNGRAAVVFPAAASAGLQLPASKLGSTSAARVLEQRFYLAGSKPTPTFFSLVDDIAIPTVVKAAYVRADASLRVESGPGSTPLQAPFAIPGNGWHTVALHAVGKAVQAFGDAQKLGDVDDPKGIWSGKMAMLLAAAAPKSGVQGFDHVLEGGIGGIRVMDRALQPDELLHPTPLRAAPAWPQRGMLPVAAGPVAVGCAGGDASCTAAEKPSQRVNVSSHWIDAREVDVAAWSACVQAGSCGVANKTTGDTKACTALSGGSEALPVTCVDWTMAQGFCATRHGRLPTEAEWERAARPPCAAAATASQCIAAAHVYPWGATAPSCTLAWYNAAGGACGASPLPTAALNDGAGPGGALHLAGNVEEWVGDWYASASWVADAWDPSGPAQGTQRVIKGGHVGSDKHGIRVSNRLAVAPSVGSPARGFRCALPW